MAQNRKPPAYLEYAASILANKNYRLMSLPERGLLYAMRLECWENQDLPVDPCDLAKYLGIQENEVKAAYTERVKEFFKSDGNKLVCPELDDYRQHLKERRAKQSEGGKKGAAKTNGKLKGSSNSQVPRQDGRESLVNNSQAQFSKPQSLESGHLSESDNHEWLSDYDKALNGT